MRQKTIDALINLGANPSNKGFKYTVDAMEIISQDENILDRLITLYVEISQRNKSTGCTPSSVERVIRHLQEQIMTYSELKLVEKYFQLSGTKMTNGKFLSSLYYKLKDYEKAEDTVHHINITSTAIEKQNIKTTYTQSEVDELIKVERNRIYTEVEKIFKGDSNGTDF